MVAVAGGAEIAGGGDALARGLVGEIAADLFGEFVEGGEEDGFFVFFEALQVAFGALGEEEAAAAGDLEALVDELVLIGVGEEAEVDAGAPDGFAIVVAVELAVAEGGLEGVGLHGAVPEFGAAGDGDGEAAFAPEAAEGLGAVVVGRADEGDLAVAVWRRTSLAAGGSGGWARRRSGS